ncbi:hypothetical protein LUZ60_007282 [Juncus effusus]|nr:hypothetical protein LUZ60_007282 [Juncus effusus]
MHCIIFLSLNNPHSVRTSSSPPFPSKIQKPYSLPLTPSMARRTKNSPPEEELTTPRRVTRQSTAQSLSISPPSFPVGARIEVRINDVGYKGSWYKAIVTDQKTVRGKTARYVVKYESLVKEDDLEDIVAPESDEVSVDDVRPEAPRRWKVTDGKVVCLFPMNQEFELYDMVEAYHNEGWWYGVISRLRNAETGKYRVSLPFSHEVFDFSPSEIRPQMNYINGNWFRVEPKPQKEETYKTGDKVEIKEIREKYGLSWFPATLEKIITDDIFLIKYENPNYLPNNGCLTEIVDCSYLRPLNDRNLSNKVGLNSDVEFFHEGAWSNGIVTRVNSNGNYLIKFGESDDVAPELFIEGFVRLSLQWDGKKWSKFKTLGKRGRLAGQASSVSAKKYKNDISPRGETSVLNKSGFTKNDSPSVQVNMKTDEDKSRDRTDSTNSPADAGADISKGNMVNSQNGGHDQTTLNSKPPSNNPISTPPNPNPNQSSTQPNPNLVSTQPNPNPNPNPSESTPSSSTSDSIILPFEWTSPVLKSLESLEVFDIFRKIPQEPHFNTLQKCCCKEEREGKAAGQMLVYASLANSIKELSLDAELADFNEKLDCLNNLEQDGFETDPLRTRLNIMLESKMEIYEAGLRKREMECELSQRHEDNNAVFGNVHRMDAELAELVERERRVREKRERELEKSVRNGDRILKLQSGISVQERNIERAREKFLAASNYPVWN